jgi:hypothetical protein
MTLAAWGHIRRFDDENREKYWGTFLRGNCSGE